MTLSSSSNPNVVQDRSQFSLKLEDTENWLYEDGEDQNKQVYIDKLAELKVRFITFLNDLHRLIFYSVSSLYFIECATIHLPDYLLHM